MSRTTEENPAWESPDFGYRARQGQAHPEAGFEPGFEHGYDRYTDQGHTGTDGYHERYAGDVTDAGAYDRGSLGPDPYASGAYEQTPYEQAQYADPFASGAYESYQRPAYEPSYEPSYDYESTYGAQSYDAPHDSGVDHRFDLGLNDTAAHTANLVGVAERVSVFEDEEFAPDLTPSLAEDLPHEAAIAEPPSRHGGRRGRRGGGEGGGRKRFGLKVRIVQGAVLVVLIGAISSYFAFDKSITVSVDGKAHKIHTFDSTVGEVLKGEGISVGPHDIVSASASTSLVDGMLIAVRYGRPLDITVDGKARQVWVTATDVGEALGELGVRADGAYLSASRDMPIGRSGLTLEVRTDRNVTVLVDGKSVPLTTTAATVQAVLAQANVSLGPQDQASVPLASFPTDGETITVERITGTTQSKVQSIPYATQDVNDPTQLKGAETVVTAGVDGTETVVYAMQTINGVKQAPKVISTTVTKPPVTEVVKVGTKPLPTSVAGADSLDWAALANCESGGNPKAVDPSGTYYGLYQFSVSTWASLGGSGLPSDAASSEQTYRAKLLYVRSGAGQWPVCGRNLFS